MSQTSARAPRPARRRLRKDLRTATTSGHVPQIRMEAPKGPGQAAQIIVVRFGREHGYTQNQLADRAQLSRAAVSYALSGDRVVSEGTLSKLAQALGVSLDQVHAFLQGRRSAEKRVPKVRLRRSA